MRYAFNGDINVVKEEYYDVVIVGSGLAGLYTALNLDPKLSCCVLTKEDGEASNSWLAQGGIAAAISTDDRPVLHLKDTLIAGAGLCDEKAVRILVDEGPADIHKLVSLRVPFDLNEYGDLRITLEGGHRKRRIVHAGGDATGRETVRTLSDIVSKLDNVDFMTHSLFVDILTGPHGVTGVVVRLEDGNYALVNCKSVVICTGGIGQVYQSSTNPSVATGDGIAAALRAGAQAQNMEFIQFHPTGLWSPDKEDRSFLISEAVRGEGGLLKNKQGIRFMFGTHELNELAPRDIVARAIFHELKATGEDHVFVDITARDPEFLANRFPTIYNECLSRGIDITKDWIPVCPVQHYLIGGIKTDMSAMTCIPGLYACGESANTGVHGANRLASNSMLECLVFGRRAAQSINSRIPATRRSGESVLPQQDVRPACTLDLAETRAKIQDLMSTYGYIVRTQAGMEKALAQVEALLSALQASAENSVAYVETLNIATLAREILTAALAGPESVGSHYREN